MQNIKVSELSSHPRNTEFFDDMSGEKWKEFLESVKSRGVIEPIVITPDKVIVSGHQRVRACKELGIDVVMCDVHTYNNEDEILQDLLETNIRQRGDIGGSAKKVGLRIKELERIYGIREGRPEKLPNNSAVKSQSDLAIQMGISVDTLQNYKQLANMIPELSELVDTGIVTKTTALSIMRNLSEQEQEELIKEMDVSKKLTAKEVKSYIDKLQEKDAAIVQKDAVIADCKQKVDYLQQELEESKEQQVQIQKETVYPDDYESTKELLKGYEEDYKNLRKQFESKVSENQDLRKQIETMNDSSTERQYEKQLQDSVLLFCSKVNTFIEKVGGYVWLSDKINEIPELERRGYVEAVNAIKAWADTMDYNINNKLKEVK